MAAALVAVAAGITSVVLLVTGDAPAGVGAATTAGAGNESATPGTSPSLGSDPDAGASVDPEPVEVPRVGDGQDPRDDAESGGDSDDPADASDADRPGESAAGEAAPVDIDPDGTCARPTVTVSSAEELRSALASASAGDVIRMRDGTYEGSFSTTASGTAVAPIALCGSPRAVLEGEGTSSDYGFHLDGAKHWRLVGFTVTNSQKGVMADGTVGTVIEGLTVHHVGDEAIHLRRHSTDNTVSGNTIYDTGNRREKFGEGIYIGSAKSNWCDITNCAPDRSDRNSIIGNTIYATTAESVDIKEGTSNGLLQGNTFDGSQLVESDADSWVDVKGNGWRIVGNRGVNSPNDGFQTHEILDGWGTANVFRANEAIVNGKGFGFSLTPVRANTVACSNTVRSAKEGYANVTCG